MDIHIILKLEYNCWTYNGRVDNLLQNARYASYIGHTVAPRRLSIVFLLLRLRLSLCGSNTVCHSCRRGSCDAGWLQVSQKFPFGAEPARLPVPIKDHRDRQTDSQIKDPIFLKMLHSAKNIERGKDEDNLYEVTTFSVFAHLKPSKGSALRVFHGRSHIF